MERVIEIFTQILFLGWPIFVVLAIAGGLLIWLVRRKGSSGSA